ncbi:MAG TPA: glycosyltransferase [Dehalococcoidia bacterium]
MFGTVPLTHRTLDDYRAVLPEERIEELRSLAAPLRGARVLHLSVTAFGTGVADMLGTSVPLMNDLGVECHWQIVRAGEEFQQVSRALYAALVGGRYVTWNSQLTDTWLRYNEMNAALLDEPFDVVVVHDPQPLGIRSFLPDGAGAAGRARWVWHSHLDLSGAQEDVWLLLRAQVEGYDAVVFESERFAVRDLPHIPAHTIPPAIDPLGPRNMELSREAVYSVMSRYGVDAGWPIMAQIAPFDENNDPLGALEVYRAVKRRVPEVRLVLFATIVPEDPVLRTYFDRVVAEAQDDPDIVVLTDYSCVGNVEINVFQRSADVVLQRALHKGFGLWVAEAMYKGRPVVAGPGVGLAEQITNGETGLAAADVEGLADAVVRLLREPELAKTVGAAGKRYIEERYLIPRFVADYVRLLRSFA